MSSPTGVRIQHTADCSFFLDYDDLLYRDFFFLCRSAGVFSHWCSYQAPADCSFFVFLDYDDLLDRDLTMQVSWCPLLLVFVSSPQLIDGFLRLLSSLVRRLFLQVSWCPLPLVFVSSPQLMAVLSSLFAAPFLP